MPGPPSQSGIPLHSLTWSLLPESQLSSPDGHLHILCLSTPAPDVWGLAYLNLWETGEAGCTPQHVRGSFGGKVVFCLQLVYNQHKNSRWCKKELQSVVTDICPSKACPAE